MGNFLDGAIQIVLNTLDLTDDLSNRNLISEQLTQTAGVTPEAITVYREYYVIGLRLWLSLDNNLISGEGAKFDQNFETSRRYLVWQQRRDLALTLIIPAEYQCSVLLEQITPSSETKKTNLTIGFLSF